MVFQTFALLPWLTVLENVELGLDAIGVSRAEASRRAAPAIDLIGLDGFRSAYPRVLSGGMRQRVGFARAMVVDPAVLLMDEPFSALDVLTAENLRTDFMDLWIGRQLSIQSVLLVTHNIEEAALMCDRVLVLSSNPSRIAAEISCLWLIRATARTPNSTSGWTSSIRSSRRVRPRRRGPPTPESRRLCRPSDLT